jgi:hypothetical protein
MSQYWQKLKDPRWQKKRLEVMQRDEFRCTSCCDDEATLNVHHAFYSKGAEPWEYDNFYLTTLCESCHEAIEGYKRSFLQSMATATVDKWMEVAKLASLLAAKDGGNPSLANDLVKGLQNV